jgi:hypothetical protein
LDYTHASAISEIVKNYAQVAAWSAGGLFFLVKALQGYLVIDMSVSVIPARQTGDTGNLDYLVASVKLQKGDRGSFRLHDARIIVTQGQNKQESRLGFERFSFRRTGKLLAINLDKLSSRIPTLNLAAGESTEVSTWFSIGKDQPCLVEVIVIGTGFLSPFVGQWRASAVSLPLPNNQT